MARLELVGLSKRYGDFHAVRAVDLAVEEGELVVLLGPSGCGKTTTLRMVAGFVEATAGRIRLGGRDITGLPPYRRNTGMVFQGYTLFPWLTVKRNVMFGPMMAGRSAFTAESEAREWIELVRARHDELVPMIRETVRNGGSIFVGEGSVVSGLSS